ncbi:MAG: VOC family protein, partial [Gemmatimonas sp.]
MAAGSRDNFGDAGEVQPATAGSYGQPAEGFRLPEGTRLGPVHLQVRALDRSLAYYEQLLGLRLVERGDAHATLAAQADVHALVVLHEHP